ncbi:MAG: sulfite exporter TauE/SafE family protein [bacterium]
MQEIGKLTLLMLIGMVAGFLNITAGGGSLLTLPFLIFLGLPAGVANGTNRIAIFVQNIFATARFHKFEVIPKEIVFIASVPALLGCALGAQLAVHIDELLFKRVLAVIMVAAVGLMFLKNSTKNPEAPISWTFRKKLVIIFTFLGLGIYGGFIQAGIGFLLIMVLTAAGYDLVRTNALKVLVILIFTPVALLIFIAHGQVDYLKGLTLAVGNAAGAWLATRVVVEKGHPFTRWIVVAAASIFAVKLFLG